MTRKLATLVSLLAVLAASGVRAQDESSPPPPDAEAAPAFPAPTAPAPAEPAGPDAAPEAASPPEIVPPPEQTEAPPPAPEPAEAPPAAVEPVGPPPPASPPMTPTLPPPAPVQTQSLTVLDLFSAGRDTGLGQDLWKGASPDIVRAVIGRLGERPLSPAAARLAVRVLVTASTAPEGLGNDADLAAARARDVLALGDPDGAAAMTERTPGVAGDPALSQVEAEAALITDQPDKACAVADALSTGRGGLYWVELRGYCQARAGKTAEAQLTQTVAAQQGADADYLRLLNAYINKSGDPGRPSLRDGVHYALSHDLGLDLSQAAPGAPLAIAAHLRAVAPPPAANAAPPSEAQVQAALAAAKSPADYWAAAMVQAPAIAALAKAGAPLTDPIPLAAAALAAGDLDDAQTIAGQLPATPSGPASLDQAILRAAVAAAAAKPDAADFDGLMQAEASQGAPRARAEAAMAVLAPAIASTDPAVRAALAGADLPGHAGRGAALALGLASDAGVKGETALLGLSIAADAGAAGPAPADRAQFELALVRVGLADAARDFAVEGLIELEPR